MTKVTVDPGICGFVTTVEVDKIAKHRVKVVINSDCESVAEMGELLTEIDQWNVFTLPRDVVIRFKPAGHE